MSPGQAKTEQSETEQADISQQNPQQFQLSGNVNFVTVPRLLKRARILLDEARRETGENNADLQLDLSAVESCNSAALALLLEIFHLAQLRNLEIQFNNLPANLLRIARAYGVEDTIREISQ